MLNPEIAKARLKEYRVDNWLDSRIAKFLKLSKKLGSIGCGIFGYDDRGNRIDRYQDERYYKIIEDSQTALANLSPQDRLKLWQIIAPKFADAIESTWQNFVTLAYQVGYSRRSFRDPNCSDTINNKRNNWLSNLLEAIAGYEEDLVWFARWCPYLGYYVDNLGYLFAAAIERDDAIGREIFDLLVASAKGEDEIGAMGRHVTRALLVANRVDGWEFIGKLLVASQRQEGLRQVILEAVDESQPIAFQRMLQLILDENLIRFAATLRAIDVWFGFNLDVLNANQAEKIVRQVLALLTDSQHRSTALASDDPQTVYLSLWASAFTDATQAIDLARSLFKHPQASHRLVAVHLLNQLELDRARVTILDVINDADLRVAGLAIQAISSPAESFFKIAPADTFERIEAIFANFPDRERELDSLVWDWLKIKVSQSTVASALYRHRRDRSAKLLIPYLSAFDSYSRSNIAQALAEIKPWDGEVRSILLSLTGDSSSHVRENVFRLLLTGEIERSEIPQLVKLLTRKSNDLRRGVLSLFLKQTDDLAIAAAEDLLAAKNILQRQAGLELLAELVKDSRANPKCQEIAQKYRSDRADKLTASETKLLERIFQLESTTSLQSYTLENALGLIDIRDLTPIRSPNCTKSIEIKTAAAKHALISLDELIHQHRQTPVQLTNWQGEKEEHLLGNITWQFTNIDPNLTRAENLARLPLADIWENWYDGNRLRDEDGFELIRAIAPRYVAEGFSQNSPILPLRAEIETTLDTYFNIDTNLRYPILVNSIIGWSIYLHPQGDVELFQLELLDTLSTNIKQLESQHPTHLTSENNLQFPRFALHRFILNLVNFCRSTVEALSDRQVERWWHLISWLNNRSWTAKDTYYRVIQLRDVEAAYNCKLINRSDVFANLFALGKNSNFYDLMCLTVRNPNKEYQQYSILLEVARECRDRILEIECERGELPTIATDAARNLGSVEGIATVVKLLTALETNNLKRSSGWGDRSKVAVISHLMRNSYPALNETPAEFAAQIKAANIGEEKLIQLAFFAPQWTNYIQQAIAIPGFNEGVWWIHAHTKSWGHSDDLMAQLSEYTPLSSQSLNDGAVDVAWFDRVYRTLGTKRWQQLDEAAKYASSGTGHQRARQFASAMLGEIKVSELTDRITQKRHQDSVRTLGLIPLEAGKKRDKDLLNRYRILQEFLRTSKQFGAQRRASEKLAVEIGMENLARTAGYADPIRLQWAMEAEAVADLADRPQTITVAETSVSLAIVEGKPEITITKAGKPLKAVPAKFKKNAEIQALTSRKQEIGKQASRMRISLEAAMCRGDAFLSAELAQLAQHPVLAPMLRNLVLISIDANQPELGYLDPTGTQIIALDSHSERLRQRPIPITATQFRIAHPHDLLATKEWHRWQQDCFDTNRQQPFKQVFRELYLPTTGEATKHGSKRYEGHQVNPQQATALFGQRGWIANYYDEEVRRTFHREGIVATVTFAYGYTTPLEVEGKTIDRLSFYDRAKNEYIALPKVPPRIFSEVMRDLDLVVSVAHIGGVDPEASASTVEMRASILRETIRLMKFTNVNIQGAHALINGELGAYSVHLGSAIVHRQPGGALCILPVSSQHRGRIFLPFVDDDPKTAEVMSKVLLLAKDREIQDPTILEQILSK